MRRSAKPARFALAALLLAAGPAAAQDEAPETGWSDTAELSFVDTGGNAEVTTLGFKNVLRWRGERAEARGETSGLRSESSTTVRTAVGTPDRFAVEERKVTEKTAERFGLKGRYDRKISARLFWFAGAGWERNEFAGFESRLTAVAGLGHTWFEREGSRFRTDYGLTWTRQEDVVDDPGTSDAFAGLRFAWEYERRLTATATYGNELAADQNLDRTEDWRMGLNQALKVTLSRRLALQVGLEALYDHQPALERIPLVDPTSGSPSGEVLVPLEELDTSLSIALVVDL